MPSTPKKCGFFHERALRATGCARIAGIDEAGRGPLAGPVVAAAVVLPEQFKHRVLTDSKKLSEKQRESLYQELTAREDVHYAVCVVESEEIDRINILRATHEAMRRAVVALKVLADHALIDGLPVRPFPIAHTAVVQGDGKSFSIAAASVLAKVTRDRLMLEMHVQYPQYDFDQHKGYGTPGHLAKLTAHGPCPIHRRTFLPVQQALLPL